MLSHSAQFMQQRLQLLIRTTLRSSQKYSHCRKLLDLDVVGCKCAFAPLYYRTATLDTVQYAMRKRIGKNVFMHVRYYSGEDNKPVTTAVSKAKTARATKPKSKVTVDNSKMDQKQPTQQMKNVPLSTMQTTKNFEVKTTKGVLSITTTIEDSKINDIVFEKTEVPPGGKPNERTNITTTPKVIATPAVQLSTNVLPITSTASEPPESTEQTKLTVESVKSKILPKFLKPRDTCPTPTEVDATAAAPAKETVGGDVAVVTQQAPPKPKRPRFDSNRSSLERNFITPTRAITDFMLKASDLDSLPKIKRRSPYEQEPPITVYWRRDVEAKAIEIWGSRENLLKESLKRECERKQYQQNIFTVKRRLRDYRREIGANTLKFADKERGLTGKSGKVVLTAIAINGTNFLVKLGGWIYSGSHSMFAECIHSLADMINQIILAYGIHKSVQTADYLHPYGYSNMKYVSALISGVGIFCMGCSLSIYHGITGIFHPEPVQDLFWAYFILGGTVFSEGATLIVAINELRRAAKENNMSFKEYVISGHDPCINVVLTEDSAAVAGVIVAAGCMGLSTYTNSPLYDAVGSILVGGILGGVASFIIYTNVQALVGKTIPPDRLEKINAALEADVMIRAIHDVKGIDMGNSLVRYKAECDFDGRELTRSYLDKQDLNALMETVKSFQSVEELEAFLLDHGENIVDLMGGEIDRIEMKLIGQFPEIRHCDLEVL